MTDEEFYRNRATHIREIATNADPFIKPRLIKLADHYERISAAGKALGSAQQSRLPADP